MTPTKVDVKPLKADVRYPEPANDQYTGDLAIPFTVTLDPGKNEGEFEVVVSYQACTDTECQLASEKRFDCVIYRG